MYHVYLAIFHIVIYTQPMFICKKNLSQFHYANCHFYSRNKSRLFLFVLFGFTVVFNNLSVIS